MSLSMSPTLGMRYHMWCGNGRVALDLSVVDVISNNSNEMRGIVIHTGENLYMHPPCLKHNSPCLPS